VFLKHFACRLLFFQYTKGTKSPLDRKELASVPFRPVLAEKDARPQRFELTKEFINPKPGSNFSFGLGMGVAVLVEKTTPGPLELPAGQPRGAGIRVASVRIDFTPKPRNDKVTV
jgi:hypothetical protein